VKKEKATEKESMFVASTSLPFPFVKIGLEKIVLHILIIVKEKAGAKPTKIVVLGNT
jgi:hypothetical protein